MPDQKDGDTADTSATAVALQEIARKPEFSQYEHAVVAHQPYAVSTWLDYCTLLEEHEASPNLKRFTERRAVAHLPKSWKLWKLHLSELVLQYQRQQQPETSAGASESKVAVSSGNSSSHTSYNDVVSASIVVTAFERALWTLSKFPRVWCMYGEFVHSLPVADALNSTQWRKLWTRALQALPVTQHDRIWQTVVPFCLSLLPTDTVSSYNRLPLETIMALIDKAIQFDFVQHAGSVAEWLVARHAWGMATGVYEMMLQKQIQSSTTSTLSVESLSESDSELLTSYIELCTQHVNELKDSKWEVILSQILLPTSNGTSTSTTLSNSTVSSSLQSGLLWTLWADAYVRQGQFDKARSLYQQGLQCVPTVRDFAVVYQAYWQLEETLVQHISESIDAENDQEMLDNEQVEAGQTDEGNDWDILLMLSSTSIKDSHAEAAVSLEQALERAEYVLQQRPLWLNAVQLRQDPRNVKYWLERAKLFWDRNEGTAATGVLEQALNDLLYRNRAEQTGLPPRVKGQPSRLIERLVDYLQKCNQISEARVWLDRLCLSEPVPLGIDWRETCWSLWIELELQNEQWDEALSLARQAVAKEPKKRASLKIWDLCLDLEESLGTVQTTKDAYQNTLRTKVATVQHVLNFASFLKDHNYFEESFTAYEKGIDLFNFPHKGAKVIWKTYLQEFLQRYQGNKLERTRDLFDRCLEHCPAEDCVEFYLMYGHWEEEYGLTKRALSVYRAMCRSVTKDDRHQSYLLWIAKTAKYTGVTATRGIYEEAMKELDDVAAARVAIEFAMLESKLQQLDRSRAIFTYAAQMADPRRLPEYWKAWNDFEIVYGSEDTFREMLRVKRSVEAAYSTVNYNATGVEDSVENMTTEEAMRMIANQEGVDFDTVAGDKSGGGAGNNKLAGFEQGTEKRNAEDPDDRASKIQKYLDNVGDNDDDAEINVDDIDAEIEAAAAEGATHVSNENVSEVRTKAVPAAVFGGLSAEAESKESEP